MFMKCLLKAFPRLLQFAHFLVRIQDRLIIRTVTFGFSRMLNTVPLERRGTIYGGWWSPVEYISSTSKRVLVSAGLGFDTSFDKEMILSGYSVIGLDPGIDSCTQAVKDLENLGPFKILNKGISTFVGVENFFEPKLANHKSWSTLNIGKTKDSSKHYFEVTSIDQLFKDFTDLAEADFKFLKMDVEGAELAILENASNGVFRFDFIGIEMDFLSLIPFLNIRKRVHHVIRARRIMNRFKENGFILVLTENFNFFWSKRIQGMSVT
jgi:FkbM family methyltransferase